MTTSLREVFRACDANRLHRAREEVARRSTTARGPTSTREARSLLLSMDIMGELIPRRRLLLVESDVPAARALSRALHDDGYDVLIATDGVSAIRRIAYDDFDAVVVDYELASTDALNVAEFARSRSPRVPVLFVTSCPDVLAHRPMRLDPPARVIDKPVAVDALEAELRAIESARVQASKPPPS